MVAIHNFDLEQLTSPGYLLVVDDGGLSAVRLYDGTIIIGSHPSCHLRIHEHTVSRCHLEVIVTEKGLAIRDLGSTNGTWLDGHRVPAATVGVGDTVTLGNCEVRILPAPEPRAPCAPPWSRVHARLGEEREDDELEGETTLPTSLLT